MDSLISKQFLCSTKKKGHRHEKKIKNNNLNKKGLLKFATLILIFRQFLFGFIHINTANNNGSSHKQTQHKRKAHPDTRGALCNGTNHHRTNP